MTWLIFSFAAIFLWSICNFIDKFLLEQYVPERNVAVVFGVYPALFSIVLLPVLLHFHPHALDVTVSNALLFIGAGMIEMTAVILYFRALQHEDTSTVVPFFQAIPVFSFILGFALLGEMLTTQQIIAGIGIVLGGALLSIDSTKGASRRFRVPLILLMLGASFCYALFDAIFKFGALREDFWTGVVWQHVGIVLTGIGVLIFSKRYRDYYLHILRSGGKTFFAINVGNEALYAGGVMLSNYALLMAPIALVGLVNAYHPVFVFIIGAVLTVLFPKLIQEDISRVSLIHKLIAVVIIVIASVFLLA